MADSESITDTLRPTGRSSEVDAAVARDRLRMAALALGYAIALASLYLLSSPEWYLPAGLRFATLWLSPPRRWLWFLVADVSALFALNLAGGYVQGPGTIALAVLVPWWSHALAIRVVRGVDIYAAPETPARMALTLAAMGLAALLNAAVQSSVAKLGGAPTLLIWSDVFVPRVIGNFVGIVTLAPLAFQLFTPRASDVPWRRMALELLLSLGVAAIVLISLRAWSARIADFISIVGLAPILFMAFRHGWRGAAWAASITSVGLKLGAAQLGLPATTAEVLLFVALVACIALVLGAATSALRRANAALVERHLQERASNARLATQAAELRELSQRLERAREEEQRRLAHDLHDELGQSVTALGARLGLLARTSEDPQVLASVAAQRELIHDIQGALRDVLQGLRPALLDRFGLEVALREGPVQRVLATAGIDYRVEVLGPLPRLGVDASSAVYRICQEAATNCVRHAGAQRFDVRLEVAPIWGDGLEVHLSLQDDGVGIDPQRAAEPTRGGLRNINDRVLALGGEHRCDTGANGTRHSIWFVDRVLAKDTKSS